MLDKGEYLEATATATATATKVEPCTSLDSTLTTSRKSKKDKDKNKRRFNDEQIRSMETMFESESKLEPRTKLNLAKELDLQPRQVAIWFQNRRARWKSKQLEKDFKLLKANYDALATQFESIKKEKQMLLIQLQKLNDLRRKPKEENSTDGDSDIGITRYEPEKKHGLSFEGTNLRIVPCSDDENNHNMYLGEEEEVGLMNVMDAAAQGNWSALDSNISVFDQSCSNSQWWEIWS